MPPCPHSVFILWVSRGAQKKSFVWNSSYNEPILIYWVHLIYGYCTRMGFFFFYSRCLSSLFPQHKRTTSGESFLQLGFNWKTNCLIDCRKIWDVVVALVFLTTVFNQLRRSCRKFCMMLFKSSMDGWSPVGDFLLYTSLSLVHIIFHRSFPTHLRYVSPPRRM